MTVQSVLFSVFVLRLFLNLIAAVVQRVQNRERIQTSVSIAVRLCVEIAVWSAPTIVPSATAVVVVNLPVLFQRRLPSTMIGRQSVRLRVERLPARTAVPPFVVSVVGRVCRVRPRLVRCRTLLLGERRIPLLLVNRVRRVHPALLANRAQHAQPLVCA